MPIAAVELIAALVTVTLLGHAAAAALAGVQFLLEQRSPQRGSASAALCQYTGTALALLGLVYRHEQIGTIGLLLVILSLLIADFRRASATPRFEVVLTVLALANLVVLTALFVV